MGIKEAVELIEFSAQFNVGVGWEDESQVSRMNPKFLNQQNLWMLLSFLKTENPEPVWEKLMMALVRLLEVSA